MTTKKTQDASIPSAEEIAAAQKEGTLNAIKDGQNTQDIDLQRGEYPEPPRFYNTIGTNQLEPLTAMGIDELKGAIDPKNENALAEEVIANLLILERNGKNRTEFVKLLMSRLKIKDIRKELPQAGGPDYTNDVSALSKL